MVFAVLEMDAASSSPMGAPRRGSGCAVVCVVGITSASTNWKAGPCPSVRELAVVDPQAQGLAGPTQLFDGQVASRHREAAYSGRSPVADLVEPSSLKAAMVR